MDREFLDRLSPPRPKRNKRKVTPREFDKELDKQLKETNYFEWNQIDREEPEDLSEVLNNEIAFKPINPGLGFHPSQKSLPNKRRAFSEARDGSSLGIFENIQDEHETKGLWEKPKYFSFEDAKKKTFKDTALHPFYEPSHEKALDKIFSKSERVKNNNRKNIKVWESAVSWATDFLFVIAMSVSNLWLMFKVSEISLDFNNFDTENYLLSASLFLFWYLMYFSVGDFIGGTIGKRLLNLKVLNIQKRPIDFSQSILRAFFSLISLVTFGLFSLFDGPSVGSKTQVYRSGKTNS